MSYKSNTNSTICYIGCNLPNYTILNTSSLAIDKILNSNVPLIIDNSDFPLLSGCNFEVTDCKNNGTINVTKMCNISDENE